jgi:hypothetical protein
VDIERVATKHEATTSHLNRLEDGVASLTTLLTGVHHIIALHIDVTAQQFLTWLRFYRHAASSAITYDDIACKSWHGRP